MYHIEIPKSINQIIAVFYELRLWNNKARTKFWERGISFFHFVFYTSFATSFAVEAFITNDADIVFLTVAFLITALHMIRIFYIIWNMSEILTLIHQLGTHRTNDHEESIKKKRKLETFMKFTKCFISACSFEGLLMAIFPIVSKKKILTDFGFQWETNRIAFWLTNFYNVFGIGYSVLIFFLAIIMWYLMMNGAIRYEILGNQLQNMGMNVMTTQSEQISRAEQEKLFLQDLIIAVKTHKTISKIMATFTSTFSYLFFLHILISKIQICGSVYLLAFSSHENLLQDGIYCLILLYNLLDILVVMYLGNEIKLSSDRLSYCLFESNWMEQSPLCQKYVIIMSEYLKQPHELLIAKLYPLNLQTYTTIVNAAYSLFNILKNVSIRN